MKRLFLPVLLVAIIATQGTALAQPTVQQPTDLTTLFNLKPTANIDLPDPAPKSPVATPVAPAPVVYGVVEGDNLSKIGSDHNVTWQRLYNKNAQIANPDLIHVGDQITIPLATETLADRAMPAVVSLPAVTPGVVAPTAPVASYGGTNTYDYGYCTWYVKNMRGASLPNGLGNANTWYERARAMGMAVGSAPAPGAVGTTTAGSLGHVVYVESLNDNGTINISEMNYTAFATVSHRTVSANEFLYIY
jgi:surface antigen